jgi:hypothetical protein
MQEEAMCDDQRAEKIVGFHQSIDGSSHLEYTPVMEEDSKQWSTTANNGEYRLTMVHNRE